MWKGCSNLKSLKSLKVWVLAMFMVMVISIPALAADTMAVNLDGYALKLDVAPLLVNDRALVPVGAIAEQLGGTVYWNPNTRTVQIETADNTVRMTLDSTTAYVNGNPVTLEVPAQAPNGRTLVPLGFVAKSLGAAVNYDAVNNAANILYFADMAGTLKVGGSTTVQPVAQLAADRLVAMNTSMSISVAGGGSGEGIKQTALGGFNVGGISKDLATADNASYPGLVQYQIGIDGIAVIVNPSNPISELSKQQVIDIFTGKITNWKDIGGPNAAIFLETREAGSGTLDGFQTLALNKAAVAATATPYSSNGLMKQAVAQNANAIGFLSMGYLDGSVKAPSIGGVSALRSKAKTHEWPYVRNLNLITKGNATGLSAKFINFLRSPAGQQMVSIDYISLKAQD